MEKPVDRDRNESRLWSGFPDERDRDIEPLECHGSDMGDSGRRIEGWLLKH